MLRIYTEEPVRDAPEFLESPMETLALQNEELRAVEGRMWAAVVGRVVRRASLAIKAHFLREPPFSSL
jgi:hypothetical protein